MNIFKFFPLIFIAVAFLNYFLLKSKVKKYSDQNEELKAGYDKLLKGFLIFSVCPWIIVVLGDLTGSTNGIFDYFHPRSLNPFVLTFHFCLMVIFSLTIYWIYFKNGADFLSKHPGLIQFQGFGGSKDITSTLSIKIFFAISLLGGIAALIMMWFIDFPNFPK